MTEDREGEEGGGGERKREIDECGKVDKGESK